MTIKSCGLRRMFWNEREVIASDKFKRVCEQVWRDREAILTRRGGLTGEAALLRAVYWRLCKAWGGASACEDGSHAEQTLFTYQRLVSILLTQKAGPHYDGSPLLNELVRRYRESLSQSEERSVLEETKIAMMKDLRVYFNPEAAGEGEHGVFYSRRRDGPYYCWRYEAGRGGWYGSRVLPSDRQVKELYPASWKALPPALRARLDEYYIE